jgi:hypothetical protein
MVFLPISRAGGIAGGESLAAASRAMGVAQVATLERYIAL